MRVGMSPWEVDVRRGLTGAYLSSEQRRSRIFITTVMASFSQNYFRSEETLILRLFPKIGWGTLLFRSMREGMRAILPWRQNGLQVEMEGLQRELQAKREEVGDLLRRKRLCEMKAELKEKQRVIVRQRLELEEWRRWWMEQEAGAESSVGGVDRVEEVSGRDEPQQGTVPNSPVVTSTARRRCTCECVYCAQYQMSQLWREQLAESRGSLVEKTRDSIL